MMSATFSAGPSFTSPLAGEVGNGAQSVGIPGGGYGVGDVRAALPPSLALPRKGGGNRSEFAVTGARP
jgi:hypothetical protein